MCRFEQSKRKNHSSAALNSQKEKSKSVPPPQEKVNRQMGQFELSKKKNLKQSFKLKKERKSAFPPRGKYISLRVLFCTVKGKCKSFPSSQEKCKSAYVPFLTVKKEKFKSVLPLKKKQICK